MERAFCGKYRDIPSCVWSYYQRIGVPNASGSDILRPGVPAVKPEIVSLIGRRGEFPKSDDAGRDVDQGQVPAVCGSPIRIKGGGWSMR